MKSRIYYVLLLLILGAGLVFLNSCEKDKIYPPDYETVDELYSIMNQWYYWKDSISDVNPESYASAVDLLNAMRFEPKDKWSYITTKEAHSQFYEEGTYVGYGFGYATDSEGNVRITFLYDDSDLNDLGIKRGWIIKKINGNSIDENSNINNLLGANEIGVSNTMEFESLSGVDKIGVFVKKLVTMNTVGSVSVIEKGTNKVGYFVFKSFIGPSEDELTDTITYFKNVGVTDLVIDLRYNGGGRMDIVTHLAGLIIPDNVDGKLFVKYEYNVDRAEEDESVNFVQDPNSLRLEKVYFITGKGSASASEAIINSLDPHIDVFIVGDDTYGKPVGMSLFGSGVSNLVYAPISFKLVNADGYGGYYDGLKADSYVVDDLKHDFGVGEAVLDEVLNHIENNSFSSSKSSGDIYRASFREIRTLEDEIGSL